MEECNEKLGCSGIMGRGGVYRVIDIARWSRFLI